MWTITLCDLQFRRRQFAIAVVGTGMAFALALVLTGMSAGFRHEARTTVDAIGAGALVVPKGVKGPFTSDSTMPAARTRATAKTFGWVQRGGPSGTSRTQETRFRLGGSA
jgi:putative ABC transport system permease protein